MFSIVLIGGLIYLFKFLDSNLKAFTDAELEYEIPDSKGVEDRYYLPSTSAGEIVHHKYYSLSYVEKYEQAEWVAYELTKESLLIPNVKRTDRYLPDYDVKTRSAFHRDYSNSGFTRGHLAPAGDMAFSEEAMKESFFMSNMSPQPRAFNNGIWRELEEQTRDWAFKASKLYIVTGPVLKDINQWIGENRVGVPHAFYKILLDLEGKEKKGIAFIIPNEKNNDHLQHFAVTIDSVENLTGIDFFDGLMDSDLEVEMESGFELRKWKIDEARFRKRVKMWNNQ